MRGELCEMAAELRSEIRTGQRFERALSFASSGARNPRENVLIAGMIWG